MTLDHGNVVEISGWLGSSHGGTVLIYSVGFPEPNSMTSSPPPPPPWLSSPPPLALLISRARPYLFSGVFRFVESYIHSASATPPSRYVIRYSQCVEETHTSHDPRHSPRQYYPFPLAPPSPPPPPFLAASRPITSSRRTHRHIIRSFGLFRATPLPPFYSVPRDSVVSI